jgi:hypothetical protein
MPRIYRSMQKEGEWPKIARSASTLGVRIATNSSIKPDIPVDDLGCVSPTTGGMSVAPSWRLLPAHRIPARLRRLCPEATGSNQVYCWTMGQGEFTDGPLASGLHVRRTSESHGLVEPSHVVPLSTYEADLAATREEWIVDET